MFFEESGEEEVLLAVEDVADVGLGESDEAVVVVDEGVLVDGDEGVVCAGESDF